jgi:hypothetical protein
MRIRKADVELAMPAPRLSAFGLRPVNAVQHIAYMSSRKNGRQAHHPDDQQLLAS